jgi:thymidylate synthase ThyX
MSYACEVLADSLNTHTKDRLTTFQVTFPRMVLADMTRHRMLSYSFESTRAVPVEKRIAMVENDPFVPRMRRKVKGMAQGEFLTGQELADAEWEWKDAAAHAAHYASTLLHVEKGLAGRLLEPFSWITGIVSGTEWDNFFNLRCHPAAQYELQVIAEMMRDARQKSLPIGLRVGEWHLPLVPRDLIYRAQLESGERYGARASAGRCAGVSYLRHRVDETLQVSAERWDEKLAPSAHWSPGEHPAQVTDVQGQYGNYKGFIQLRKFYANEAVAVDPA